MRYCKFDDGSIIDTDKIIAIHKDVFHPGDGFWVIIFDGYNTPFRIHQSKYLKLMEFLDLNSNEKITPPEIRKKMLVPNPPVPGIIKDFPQNDPTYTKDKKEILDTNLGHLSSINTRLYNVLSTAGIKTIAGLASQPRDYIRKLHRMGGKSIKILDGIISELGLKWEAPVLGCIPPDELVQIVQNKRKDVKIILVTKEGKYTSPIIWREPHKTVEIQWPYENNIQEMK